LLTQPKFTPTIGTLPVFSSFLPKEVVINMWRTNRQKRIRVSGNNLKMWMSAACSNTLNKLNSAGAQVDPFLKARLEKFEGKDGWLTGFLKSFNLVRRRATNKRSHGVQDLLGGVLGFTRFLRGLRRENPSDEDSIWGVYGRENTLNVDSVPICFCSSCKTTIELCGAKRVSIIVPGSGLDKRQATLHLCIRCGGIQPWPTIVLKGAMTADGKEDTEKRKKEMAKYKNFKVHVLWQQNSWLSEELAVNHWIPCFKKDLARLGLLDKHILLIADNLDAQKTEAYRAVLSDIFCLCVYGPKNGTDVWQPVDHGIGQRYQDLIAGFYSEWTKSDECIQLLNDLKAPSAPLVRALLVEWVHLAYESLERDRIEKDRQGQPSIFELAFLRTSVMVSANGDEIDKEMKPEGVEEAMMKSTDPYYKDHGISCYQQLLECSDNKCGHADDHRKVIPAVPSHKKQSDLLLVKTRFTSLEESKDPRAQLIVRCLKKGFKWAGSSFVVFLSNGVEELLEFLSEMEGGEPAHDVDLYRIDKTTTKLGVRLVSKTWDFPKPKKARAVDKYTFTLSQQAGALETGATFAVDQVNLFKSKMKPSTDLWPNLCGGYNGSNFLVENLFQDFGVPLAVSLNHALRIGKEENVPCYVLRREAMPKYDEGGNFVSDESYCDGRFRGKLHKRQLCKSAVLCPHWKPGRGN
jgi:hypothetical protein